jgi:hypothetical protein
VITVFEPICDYCEGHHGDSPHLVWKNGDPIALACLLCAVALLGADLGRYRIDAVSIWREAGMIF